MVCVKLDYQYSMKSKKYLLHYYQSTMKEYDC